MSLKFDKVTHMTQRYLSLCVNKTAVNHFKKQQTYIMPHESSFLLVKSSGIHSHSNSGKPPFLIGVTSTNGWFPIVMLVYQRVIGKCLVPFFLKSLHQSPCLIGTGEWFFVGAQWLSKTLNIPCSWLKKLLYLVVFCFKLNNHLMALCKHLFLKVFLHVSTSLR